MEAKLSFSLDAPSPDVALEVIETAVRQFNASHPGVIKSIEEGVWSTESNAMLIPITVNCASQMDAVSLNDELGRLFVKQQRARGIVAKSAELLVKRGIL